MIEELQSNERHFTTVRALLIYSLTERIRKRLIRGEEKWRGEATEAEEEAGKMIRKDSKERDKGSPEQFRQRQSHLRQDSTPHAPPAVESLKFPCACACPRRVEQRWSALREAKYTT